LARASAALHEVVARALNVASASISDESSPETLRRWDSLHHLDLMNTIEDAYDVRFSTAEIVQARSVGDIRRLLREKGVDVG
jgi:acyl carrier protein